MKKRTKKLLFVVARAGAGAWGLSAGGRRAKSNLMVENPRPRIIDMTTQGEFVVPPAARASWPLRLGVGAALVAAIAGGLAVAALFLWVASILIPVALVAGLVAYAAFRFQMWRLRR